MKKYQNPEIESICEVKTETVFAAQSWNNGKGNTDHNGTGNGGVNYDNGDTSNQFREEQDTHGNNSNKNNNGKGNGC